MIKLGVNIDHVATLRNARGGVYPSIATAAGVAEQNGADFITIHLREDRRHITDKDLIILNQTVTTYLNLEMACNEDVLKRALEVKPYKVTLVPEKREERTTEGGLAVKDNLEKITRYTKTLQDAGIIVSLFIEDHKDLIETYKKTGATEIEIHTGHYANEKNESEAIKQINNMEVFSKIALDAGFKVCAGHGLNYHNVNPICSIKEITELNIGHAIVSQAIFTGLGKAVSDMKRLVVEGYRSDDRYRD